MQVKDVMTRSVIVVRPETTLKLVARLLIDHRVSGVPVVDAHDAVLGVVSESDFVQKEQARPDRPTRLLEAILRPRGAARAAKAAAITAGEAMTTPAIVVGPTATIAQAAAQLARHRIGRLPVVEDGRLVGLVSRADLLRAYVRSDAELTRAIREDVILGILWLDPTPFQVTVTEGVARVRGRVERRSTAELLERASRMVPGVVSVDADVQWSLDDDVVRPATPDPIFPFGAR
jgi:CBS-domain-containing membrane protein